MLLLNIDMILYMIKDEIRGLIEYILGLLNMREKANEMIERGYNLVDLCNVDSDIYNSVLW